jgi:hypothetical protein
MADTFEPVHVVDEYYDGPRTGSAEYRGQLHTFRSLTWEAEVWDPDEDRFELTPVRDGRVVGPSIIMRGEFRARQPVPALVPGVLRPLEVCWRNASITKRDGA